MALRKEFMKAGKRARRPAGNSQRGPLRRGEAHTEIGAPPEAEASFDPSLFLRKLGAGKQTQEYEEDATVFAQGDVADAVFYIESGKVKLTVVSKQGKEAVVAILSEGSFFGEGCLAGQSLGMAAASTDEDRC